MKTRFNSIALTLVGVTIFGLALANNGSVKAFAPRDGDNPYIENVRIINDNPNDDKDENRKCCDPNVLNESPADRATLDSDQTRLVDDENLSQGDDDNLSQDDVANVSSRDENRDDAQDNYRHSNPQH